MWPAVYLITRSQAATVALIVVACTCEHDEAALRFNCLACTFAVRDKSDVMKEGAGNEKGLEGKGI